MSGNPFWLTREQFSKIAPHRATDEKSARRMDDRREISGIDHVLNSGGRWIDAPGIHGTKTTLFMI